MQKHTSPLRLVRSPEVEPRSGRSSRKAGIEEKRIWFKSLVVHSLDAGFLRYSRRQELLKVAEQLGINEFDACLLIAEAQFHSDQIDPADPSDLDGFDVRPIARRISISTWIASALVVATLVDLLVIVWLS